MKTWSQCCDEAGYSREEYKDAPKVREIYFAYKNGEVKRFTTKSEAKSFSSMVETLANSDDKAALDSFWKILREKESKAMGIWNDALKEEFDYLDTRLFNLCYDRAYVKCHGDGVDAVYYEMEDLVEFAHKIMECFEK